MDPLQPGSKNLPDFKQLTDRLIADAPSQPMLVIKTNIDPKDVTEDNPYTQNKQQTDNKSFLDFFEE